MRSSWGFAVLGTPVFFKPSFAQKPAPSPRSARLALVAAIALLVAACSEDGRLPSNSRHFVALSPQIEKAMAEKGMNARQPILLRAYKKESELEVWKQNASGEYELLNTYPMCRWSGQLGPKKAEGDRQVPEGFYNITPQLLNPNSAFYLSFNIGYPNAFDRAHGRNGSHIMVHGACSSRGCFSMTDEQIADIYALSREAFGGGQKAIQLQSFPFRMNAENLARYRADEHMPFWKNLKEGHDHFEVTKREPQVAVCARRYVFNAQPQDGARVDASSACPPMQQDEALVAAVRAKSNQDEFQVAALVSSGVKAVKRVYQDGDQHPSFKHTTHALAAADTPALASFVPQSASKVADVSQPDALAHGAVDLPAEHARGLSRQALLTRAAQARLQEASLEAAASAPAPASSAAAEGRGSAVAPPPSTATALVATEPRKAEPAFYQRWLSLGGLTASASGAQEVGPQPHEAPIPPRAPKR
jgi:murein L,D-transpeptidase YafK